METGESTWDRPAHLHLDVAAGQRLHIQPDYSTATHWWAEVDDGAAAGLVPREAVQPLTAGELHAWRIVTNVGKAVDAILDGEKYKAQTRSRNPSDGSLSLLLGEF